jgi:ABC-type nitrate/sulfonate/bicarbonate transport system substrate-binding protein
VGAQTPVLRIGTAVGDSFAEPYYANDGGFFAKAGFNVDITLFPQAGAILAAYAGGSLDIAVGDSIGLANAYNRGVPFAFFAGSGMYTSSAPTTVLLVAKNSPYRVPKDLEGQTIAIILLASTAEIGLREWMRVNNVDQNKVKLIEMPGSSMPAAATRGVVGAWLGAEPVLTDAVRSGEARVVAKPFDEIGKQFMISSWYASREFIGRNPEMIARLTSAIYETARWANTNHDGTAPILAK